jgi:hypothetical protein
MIGRKVIRVRCGPAEEVAITVGVPQIATDLAAMPQSAGAGQLRSLRCIANCCADEETSGESVLIEWKR